MQPGEAGRALLHLMDYQVTVCVCVCVCFDGDSTWVWYGRDVGKLCPMESPIPKINLQDAARAGVGGSSSSGRLAPAWQWQLHLRHGGVCWTCTWVSLSRGEVGKEVPTQPRLTAAQARCCLTIQSIVPSLGAASIPISLANARRLRFLFARPSANIPF